MDTPQKNSPVAVYMRDLEQDVCIAKTYTYTYTYVYKYNICV